MELIAVYILLGLITGLFSGLLGIGGGVIIVPSIYYLLTWNGSTPDHAMEIAISTSLASIIVTSSATTYVHHRKRAVHFPLLGFLLPGLILGCVIGAKLAHFLPEKILRSIFGSVVILLAIYFSFPKMPTPHFGHKRNSLLIFFGLCIGQLSSLLGIGGGVFSVPILLGYHISFPNAVATSSAATLTAAIAGSLTYFVLSLNHPPLPHSLGFVDLYALFPIALGSVLTAPIGSRLAHTLPTGIIKRIFAAALFIMGIAMLRR